MGDGSGRRERSRRVGRGRGGEGRVTEGRCREKRPVGHGQGNSTPGASASMTQSPCPGCAPGGSSWGPGSFLLFARLCAWGCGGLQPPPVSAQEPLPLWGRHPGCWGLTPIPQPSCYSYYYAIIAYSCLRAQPATGEERPEVGWGRHWAGSHPGSFLGGQGDGRGAVL